MDLEAKLSSLKNFVQHSSSSRTTPNGDSGSNGGLSQTSNGQSNSWSNGWFKQAEEDPYLPSLTRKQRVLGFFMCLLFGAFCFIMAGFLAPFILLKARKFVLLYTMGSLFTIGSFSFLWGPTNHMKHLCSLGRLPFTAAYFGSMFATIYVAMFMKSTVLTAIFAVVQVLTLVWYLVSYIPGGTTGLKFFTKLFSSAVTKTVSNTLPV